MDRSSANDFWLYRIVNFWTSVGVSEHDSPQLKIKKRSLTLVPLIIGPAAFIWGLIYFYLGHILSGMIPFSYSLFSLYTLFVLYRTKSILFLEKTQLTLVMFLPFLLMWSLGGFALGSYVFIWAFYAPVAVLAFEESQRALRWFGIFMLLVLVSTFLDAFFIKAESSPLPQLALEIFFLLNIGGGLGGLYLLVKYFVGEKDKNAHRALQKEHEALLESTKALKEANDKLYHLANYDMLTDMPNRYYLREHLVKMLARARRQNHVVALMFIDLDGFKTVNDTYGHTMGDKVLQTVSDRIKSCLREEDVVARLGGDEFAVVISDLQNQGYVETVAQRIVKEINKDFDHIPAPSPIGASIGISIYPTDGENEDTLINAADKAMYAVKQKGKNNYMFYSKSLRNQETIG